MTRSALPILALCTILDVRSLAAQAVPSSPSVTMTLANGLTVVMNEDHSVPNVAVELWVRAGSRYEDAGHWGQAHFFEHMFGATRVPSAPGRVLEGNAHKPGVTSAGTTCSSTARRSNMPWPFKPIDWTTRLTP